MALARRYLTLPAACGLASQTAPGNLIASVLADRPHRIKERGALGEFCRPRVILLKRFTWYDNLKRRSDARYDIYLERKSVALALLSNETQA